MLYFSKNLFNTNCTCLLYLISSNDKERKKEIIFIIYIIYSLTQIHGEIQNKNLHLRYIQIQFRVFYSFPGLRKRRANDLVSRRTISS